MTTANGASWRSTTHRHPIAPGSVALGWGICLRLEGQVHRHLRVLKNRRLARRGMDMARAALAQAYTVASPCMRPSGSTSPLRRPATFSTRGTGPCPHALASQAGVDILRAGGSAGRCGDRHVGGTVGALSAHDRRRWRRLLADLRCRAGARALSRRWWPCLRGGHHLGFERRGLSEIPFRGVLPGTLTMPGAVASWCEAHAAYGRVPLARALDSAIGYARDGFPVTARLPHWIAEAARTVLTNSPEAAAICPAARAHGARLDESRSRTHAGSHRARWPGRLYEGDVARELVRFVDRTTDGS